MRTRRDETDKQRDARLAEEARTRRADIAAQDKAVDALIKRSISLYGP